MSPDAEDRIVDMLVDHMSSAGKDVQKRQIEHFMNADAELGTRVARGPGIAEAVPA